MEREIKDILITGAAGSAAWFLIKHLQENQPQVTIHGAVRRKSARSVPESVITHEMDLLDTASIVRVLTASRPHVVFHLAANPDKGFDVPSAIIQNNTIGTVNLFEAIRISGEWPLVINVSSAEIYGAVNTCSPIKETETPIPLSPYAVSKLAQDHLGRIYHRAYGIPLITTRAFSYINPRHTGLFTTQAARQIALIEQGKKEFLEHGFPYSHRCFADVDDIASAYWDVATKGTPGEVYNIGGDVKYTVSEMLDKLICRAKVPVIKKQVGTLQRPLDVYWQVSDSTKFREATGWRPTVDIEKSLDYLVDYWRAKVASN